MSIFCSSLESEFTFNMLLPQDKNTHSHVCANKHFGSFPPCWYLICSSLLGIGLLNAQYHCLSFGKQCELLSKCRRRSLCCRIKIWIRPDMLSHDRSLRNFHSWLDRHKHKQHFVWVLDFWLIKNLGDFQSFGKKMLTTNERKPLHF